MTPGVLQTMTAPRLRLGSVLVVVTRCSTNLDVISIISGIRCTAMIEDEQIGKFLVKKKNVLAHELARQGRVNSPSAWLDDPPDFLVKFLADDVSVI